MNAVDKLLGTFDSLWRGASDMLPTLLLGILILLGGWIIAKIIAGLVLKILNKTKDSKAAKSLNMDDLSRRLNVEINLAVIISKVVYWFIFLFFIVAAAETFGWHNVSIEISNFIQYLPKLLSALLIFILGYTIISFLRTSVKSIAKSAGIGIGNFLGEFLFYFLLLIVSLTAMAQAGLDTTLISSHMYIIVSAGAVTVTIAVGLGAREVVTDLLKNYYNRGVLEEGENVHYKDVIGKVVQISKTSIVIETATDKVVVPSKDFYAATYKILKS